MIYYSYNVNNQSKQLSEIIEANACCHFKHENKTHIVFTVRTYNVNQDKDARGNGNQIKALK